MWEVSMSSYICSVLLGKWGCITGRGGSICEDDGTIWYGTQAGKVENCAKKIIPAMEYTLQE